MSVKALGIALKLTFEGMNQFKYFETWFFTIVVLGCCLLQINYLNKVSFGFLSQINNACIVECGTLNTLFFCDVSYLIWKTMFAGFGHLQHCCHITSVLRHVYLIHNHRQHNHV